MSSQAVSVVTARVRPGRELAFSAWQIRHNTILSEFPGFISSDIIPPQSSDKGDWTMVPYFCSSEELAVWLRSNQRTEVIDEVLSLLKAAPWK